MADSNAAAEAAAVPAPVTENEQPTEHENTANAADAGSTETAKTDDESPEQAAETNDSDRKDHRNGGHRNGGHRPNIDRYRGKGYKQKTRNTEFDNLEQTDEAGKILEQIEFYFMTANLRQDDHMFKEMGGVKNEPISLKHIHTFNRMRRFQPYSSVVKAIPASELLELVNTGEYSGAGNEGVRLKVPLTIQGVDQNTPVAEQYKQFKSQSSNIYYESSIYLKGFAEGTGQIELEDYYKPFGAVQVRKRFDSEKKWKRSIFIEFDSPETAKQYLANNPKPTYKGNDLLIMSKRAYTDMKCDEKGIPPEERNYDSKLFSSNNERGSSGGRGRGGRGRGHNRGRGRGYGHSRGHDSGRRDRDRSRSPRRRRHRSDSRDSVDSRDSTDSRNWNGRRDKFQKSRGYKGDRRDRDKDDRRDRNKDKSGKQEIDRDENGVPIIKDTRKSSPGKRKGDDLDREETKKSKVEIKEDS